MGIRLALVTCLATLVVAAVASAGASIAPDTARRAHPPLLKGATKLAGPYKSGIVKVDFLGEKTLFMKVVSTANEAQTWTLVDAFEGAYDEYGYQWFHKQSEITIAVENAGYDFNLKPDKPSKFRVTVTQQPPDQNPLCLYPTVSRNGGPEFSGVRFAINGHDICV